MIARCAGVVIARERNLPEVFQTWPVSIHHVGNSGKVNLGVATTSVGKKKIPSKRAIRPQVTELIRWGMANKQQCVIPDAIATALADPNYDFTAGLLTARAAERSALTQS